MERRIIKGRIDSKSKCFFPQVFLVLVCLMIFVPFASAADPAWKVRNYKYSATPASSTYFLWGAYAMKLIQADTGLNITVLESSGGEENMFRIQNRTTDFGHTDAVVVKNKFGDKHDIRHMFTLMPGLWQFVVARDANIKSLKDLNGKKWNPGPVGGGSTAVTMQIMEILGIKPNYYQGTLDDAAEAYSDRQIVGFAYRGTGGEPTGAIVEAHSARPLNFINLTDQEITKIREKFYFAYKSQIAPKTYPDQPDPVVTFATCTTGPAANKDMPAEAVYEIIKSYFKNHKAIEKQFPSDTGTPEESVLRALLPFHVGAVKYYREIGLKVPDNLIPPESK